MDQEKLGAGPGINVNQEDKTVDLAFDLEEVGSDEAAVVEPLVREDTRVHAELVGDDDGIELEAAALEVVAAICSSFCPSSAGDISAPRSDLSIGVLVSPGRTSLTRTPLPARSSAAARVIWLTAPFDAQ